jgi:hypothetical protein
MGRVSEVVSAPPRNKCIQGPGTAACSAQALGRKSHDHGALALDRASHPFVPPPARSNQREGLAKSRCSKPLEATPAPDCACKKTQVGRPVLCPRLPPPSAGMASAARLISKAWRARGGAANFMPSLPRGRIPSMDALAQSYCRSRNHAAS